MAKILLAGGTGLIGSRLIPILNKRGHATYTLSRQKGLKNNFYWDPDQGQMDPAALEGTDIIVNLAGASLADGRWTKKNKEAILNSRVIGARQLFQTMKQHGSQVHTYVSAAAIGYYGNTGDAWVDESSPPGNDFLATTCVHWEEEAMTMGSLGIRTVRVRTGLVLDKEGGIYPVMSRPVRWGLAASLGSGRQYMSWIHIRDLCGIYLMVLENQDLQGAYNAVAPAPVHHEDFVRTMATVLHRPAWLPKVPEQLLKIVLGEKAMLVLIGQRVSAEKVMKSGYVFEFNMLEDALKNLEDSSQRREGAKEKR